jgi:hypothetical protein
MKLLFKPLSMLASVLGGMLAGKIFSRVWGAVTGESVAPAPDSTEHRTREVLLAAVLQGAIFGGVTAAVDRASAKGVRSLTDRVDEGARAA